MTEQEWRDQYRARLIANGFPPDIATEHAQAQEYLPELTPNEAADDETAYMMEDPE